MGTTLENLAELYRVQGRFDEAEPLYLRALEILEKTLGPEHPEVAVSLNNLAELYRAQGRFEEAAPLYEKALAAAEAALGPDHPDVALILSRAWRLSTSRRAAPLRPPTLNERAEAIRKIER